MEKVCKHRQTQGFFAETYRTPKMFVAQANTMIMAV